MRPPTLRAGLLVPPFLLWFASAAALADDFQEEDSHQEQVQVTATRREATAFDVSAAISVVSEEEVQAHSPDVLAEMLRGLPGAWFQQTTAGQGIPIIRGLKGSQVLHLVDGMRLNNAFFRSAPNQYLGLVDPYATGSVEVLRGAAGTLYGADAMGGVLNVLTPEPELDGSSGSTGGRFYGAWSSADNGWVSHADFSGASAQTGFLLGASYQERGDRKTGAGQRLRPSGFRSRAANAKLLHRFGEDAELMLAVQLLEQPSTPRTDELISGFGQSQPAASEFEFMPNRREFFHGRYRWHGSGGWLDELEIHAARQVIDDDRRTRDFESSLRNEEQNHSTLDGLTVQFNSDAASGALLTWGLEYYSDTVRSARTRRDIETGSTTMVTSRFPDGSTMDSAAAYLSSEWHPAGRLDLNAGLRYSHFDIRLPAGAGPVAVRLTPSDLTGNVHAVWALSDRLNLVANLGRGFRPSTGAWARRSGQRTACGSGPSWILPAARTVSVAAISATRASIPRALRAGSA